MLCSKMLPSSDSCTERRARLSLGFLFILPLNTADSLSPFQLSQLLYVCHSVSPTVCLSRLLALPLPAFPRAVTPLTRKARGCGEGRRETQEMGNLNEATTYSAAVGPNPYLVLLCGHWVGTLLCSAEQCGWCNSTVLLSEQHQHHGGEPQRLIFGFYLKINK